MDRHSLHDLVNRYLAVIVPAHFVSEYAGIAVPVTTEYSDPITGDTVWVVTDRQGGMVALLDRPAKPGCLINSRRYYGPETEFGAIETYVLAGFVPARIIGYGDEELDEELDEEFDEDE